MYIVHASKEYGDNSKKIVYLPLYESLEKKYQANPRNKLIAEAFYLAGDIEKYGSGFIRIRKEIETYPTMRYDYKEMANGFLVELKYQNQRITDKPEKVGEKVGENLTDNQLKIIHLVEKNNYITAKEVAEAIKISHRKMQANMLKL